MRRVGSVVGLLLLALAIAWVSTGISEWLQKATPESPAARYVLIEVMR